MIKQPNLWIKDEEITLVVKVVERLEAQLIHLPGSVTMKNPLSNRQR